MLFYRVYVVCSLKDPLPVNLPERFGIDLSTIDLTEIGDITFESEVCVIIICLIFLS